MPQAAPNAYNLVDRICNLVRGAPAIGRNDGAGDHARLVRSEKERDVCDIDGFTQPERILVDATRSILTVDDRAAAFAADAILDYVALGLDTSCADGIHPDVVLHIGAGHGARERQYRALGRSVDMQGTATAQRGARRHVNDGTATRANNFRHHVP